jgi:hypothetical protein
MPWVEVIGWTGAIILVGSLLRDRAWRGRGLTILAAFVLGVYGALVTAWPVVAVSVAVVTITVADRARARSRLRTHGYTLLEVDPRDEYLRHVMRVHEDDIRRFNPGFVFDPAQPGATAFMVLRGDETAGVVLLVDGGPGIARLQLDYVTPRYRDFTPSQFVYERSGWFADHGYRLVVAPPRMARDDPYLQRMGFRQQGDEWVRAVS